jgi:tRNA/rRNA methyltransferase
MGIEGAFRIVGTSAILDDASRKLAKHAAPRLDGITFFPSLAAALAATPGNVLKIASTARIGSAHRPHPQRVHQAMAKAVEKLVSRDTDDVILVFGPEGDGLTNEEVDLCDWVVTIPSAAEYRSLNLAQAILVFCYEVNRNLLLEWEPVERERMTQKQRLVTHLVQLAEEVGFVLPGDPYKMRPRLEEIFGKLPNHIEDVRTLHGLIDQTIRSVRKGGPDIRGRYRHSANRPSPASPTDLETNRE